jgi:hypothetical protein
MLLKLLLALSICLRTAVVDRPGTTFRYSSFRRIRSRESSVSGKFRQPAFFVKLRGILMSENRPPVPNAVHLPEDR